MRNTFGTMNRRTLAGLFELVDLGQLVPASHAAYRPLLTDGLLFFLERLEPVRLEAIVAE